MLKTEIVKDMKAFNEGSSFITKEGLARYMGYKSYDPIKQIVVGIEAYKGKLYFIPDIAEAIKSKCEQ